MLHRNIAPAPVIFVPGLAGSAASLEVMQALTTFTLKNNGVAFGTFQFAVGATVATFTVAAQVKFVKGDQLAIVAPASPDAMAGDLTVHPRGTFV